MLYLFHGTNTDETRKKRESFLQQLFLKKPNVSFFEYGPENFKKGDIEELSSGRGLFEEKHIVFLRGALALPEAEEHVLGHAEILSASPNVFIFEEEKIKAPMLKVFREHAKKIWESKKDGQNLPERQRSQSGKNSFNSFAFTDAFLARDRKKTWVEFCRTIDGGMEIEKVHGGVFAQVKNMLLVKRENKNPGLHPFVFQKTTRGSKNYSEKELEDLSAELVELYHDARRGMCDMRVGLERFILKI